MPDLVQIARRPRGAGLRDEGEAGLRWRQAKVHVLQGMRLLRWLREPGAFAAPEHAAGAAAFPFLLYERRLQIARRDPASHPIFEAGKLTNLRLAAPAFDGLLLTPGRPLSYWRTLGRVSAGAGFRPGMELRGGCIVPALGGGLCLLSNALFGMAAHLGWTILERHGHTMEAVPPAPGDLWGLDATVFWPYVDLRFAPAEGRALLEVRVEGESLRIAARGERPAPTRVELLAGGDRVEEAEGGRVRTGRIRRRVFDLRGGLLADEVIAVNRKRLLHQEEQRRNCMTCDETACHARPRLLSVLR